MKISVEYVLTLEYISNCVELYFRKLIAINQSTINPPQILSKTDKSKTPLLCAIVLSHAET